MTVTGDDEAKKLWDLVHFIEALPFPSMLPDDVRAKVYGQAQRGVASLAPTTK